MFNKIKIAVVILNWNGKAYLEKFLPSVVSHSNLPNTKIIIVDNASTDQSIDFLRENYPNLQIIIHEKNYGFSEGYNKALYNIDAEYFILLNTDVEVTPDWIKPIIDVMDANPQIGACMPKILSYDNRDCFEYAGAAGGFIDKLGYPFCRGRILNKIEKDTGQYNDSCEIFWATGACMFVRASIFKTSGGLDTDFFAHMEEIDLCWRLKNMGKKIYYFSDVAVYHVGGGTLPNNNPHKIYLNYRNNLLLLYKNLPTSKLFITLLVRIFLDWMSAMVYFVNLNFSFCYAVIKAHIRFYLLVSKFVEKRRSILNWNNNQIIHPEIFKQSILMNFFVKRKKIFTKLNFLK